MTVEEALLQGEVERPPSEGAAVVLNENEDEAAEPPAAMRRRRRNTGPRMSAKPWWGAPPDSPLSCLKAQQPQSVACGCILIKRNKENTHG